MKNLIVWIALIVAMSLLPSPAVAQRIMPVENVDQLPTEIPVDLNLTTPQQALQEHGQPPAAKSDRMLKPVLNSDGSPVVAKFWQGSIRDAKAMKSQLHAERKTGKTWKAPKDRTNPYVKGHLVVGFKQSARGKYAFTLSKDGLLKTGMPSIDALNAKYGAKGQKNVHEHLFPAAYTHGLDLHHVFYVDEALDIEAVAREYARDANVQFAEPDYIPFLAAEVSPRYENGPVYLDGTKQVAGSKPDDPRYDWAPQILQVDRARTVTNGDGTGGTRPDTFLMLDTDPINITHDDLDLNIGDYGGTSPTTTTQADAHGHMCTGHAVAEINNSLCVTGVAGGNNATRGIMVAYYRYTSSADNATGISWGVARGVASIAQASLYFANTQVLENAFKAALDAGAPAYISAGNDRNNDNNMYPAHYDCVTAVGGITWNGRHWAWDDTSGSCYGDWVDIVAPGDAHVSLSSVGSNSVAMVEGYGGTSWAAPEVAAIAALCHHTTGLTGTALQNAVLRTANNNDHINAEVDVWTIPAGYGGTGIANAYEAVTACDVNASVDFVSINSDRNSYANHGDLYLRSYAERVYNVNDTLFMDRTSFARGVYQTDRTLVPDVTVYPKAMVHNHGVGTKAFSVTASDFGGGWTSTKQVALESGQGQLVTFDGWTPTGTGACSLQVFSDLVGDLNRLNDTVRLVLTKSLRDTVYMDDGTYDMGYSDASATWGVKFTPERPCTMTAVSFNLMIRRTVGGAPAWYCSLEVWDANGQNGKPGSRLYGVNIPLTTVGTTAGWKTFTLPASQVISKPVYVCLQQFGASGGDTTTVAGDYRKASAVTYYSMNNGASWDELGNDYAIRPIVGYQATNANDIGVAAITRPVPPFAKGSPMTAIATVTNFGTATQTNIPVVAHYDSVGGTRVTKITSNKTIASLAPGASTEVVFDPWTPGGSGNTVYAFDVTVRANHTGDSWAGNDSIRTAIDSVRSQVELTAGEGGAATYGFDGLYVGVKFQAAAACSVQQGLGMFYNGGSACTGSDTCFVWNDNNGVPGTRAGWIVQTLATYPTWTVATFSGTGIYMPAGPFWLGWYGHTSGSQSILSDAQDGGNGRSFSGATEATMSADGQDYLIHARIKYLSSPDADLGIESQDNPPGVVYPNFSVVPKATVLNGGRTVLSNPQVTCQFIDSADGSTDYNQTVTIASIAPTQTMQLSYPAFTPQASVTTYWFKTFRVGPDDFAGNDRDSMKVYTSTLTEIDYSAGSYSIWITDASDGATDTLYKAVRFTPDLPCSLMGMWEFIYRTNTGRTWRACSTYAWHRTNGYKNWPSDRHILREEWTPAFTGAGGWSRRAITPTYFDAGTDFWLGAWTPGFSAAQCSMYVVSDDRADGRSFIRWNPRDSASNGTSYTWLPMNADFNITALVKYLGGPDLVVKGLVSSVTSDAGMHFRTYLSKNLDQVYDETKPGAALSAIAGSQALWQFNARNFWPMWNRGDTILTVIDYEADGGTASHAGYYAFMNDTLRVEATEIVTNQAALRAIPVPTATKVNNDSVSLSWSQPSYDAGKPNINPCIGYRIYRSTDGINFTPIASITSRTTTYIDPNLAAGSTYYYAIKLRYWGSINAKDGKAVTIESQYTSANSNGISITLSVEFSQMGALVRGNDVTINWRTESEDDSYHWIVERSQDDGATYAPLATLNANPGSTVPTDYSYTDRGLAGGIVYLYRLVEVSTGGGRAHYGPISVGPLKGRPLTYALEQARPNPFQGAAGINYQLRDPGRVSLKVYNIQGQLVRTLVDAAQDADYYT
ncbi:hypothetical protein EG831_01315, partial [bacterium]|nr:hypothetical protein [bacterium]